VYVAPQHQRRGVGRALYQELFSLLTEQGFTMACAGVTLPNDASVGLHEALGFQPVGVYRRIGFKFGAWRDVGWWQLPLADPGDGPPPEPGPPIRIG
jgi:phosphinothricin acetyltransferase